MTDAELIRARHAINLCRTAGDARHTEMFRCIDIIRSQADDAELPVAQALLNCAILILKEGR